MTEISNENTCVCARNNGTLVEITCSTHLWWFSEDPEASETAVSSKYSEFAGMIDFFSLHFFLYFFAFFFIFILDFFFH